jgi:Mrp family chromosome partitioning ATPase
MTIINRALHKAYKRRAEAQRVPELIRPGSASGWVSKLREPVKPPLRPTSEPAGSEPAVPAPLIAEETTSGIPVSDIPAPENPVVQLPVSQEHQPRLTEQWSWPPIVQRLLTCPAAPGILELAVQLRSLATGRDLRCVAFSGPGRGAGRTSLVLTLASVLIADKSTRVAIVDADFNHPDAAQALSLHPVAGLAEAIHSPAASGVVTKLITGRLAVVPLVKPVKADAIDHRRLGALQSFLRSLRREHDILLIDAGPWEPARGSLLLECRAVDALVSIRRGDSSLKGSAEENNFRQPGVEWLGVVETFVEAQPADPGHN